MDAVLESKIVQCALLNLAIWAHHSISGVKIQHALLGVPRPSEIKNIRCAHMHARVRFFQGAGNAVRLPHQLRHVYSAPGTSLRLWLHQHLCNCSKHAAELRYSGTSLSCPPNTGGFTLS